MIPGDSSIGGQQKLSGSRRGRCKLDFVVRMSRHKIFTLGVGRPVFFGICSLFVTDFLSLELLGSKRFFYTISISQANFLKQIFKKNILYPPFSNFLEICSVSRTSSYQTQCHFTLTASVTRARRMRSQSLLWWSLLTGMWDVVTFFLCVCVCPKDTTKAKRKQKLFTQNLEFIDYHVYLQK